MDAASQAHPRCAALFFCQHKLSLFWIQHLGLTRVRHVHDLYSSHFGTKIRRKTSFQMADHSLATVTSLLLLTSRLSPFFSVLVFSRVLGFSVFSFLCISPFWPRRANFLLRVGWANSAHGTSHGLIVSIDYTGRYNSSRRSVGPGS